MSAMTFLFYGKGDKLMRNLYKMCDRCKGVNGYKRRVINTEDQINRMRWFNYGVDQIIFLEAKLEAYQKEIDALVKQECTCLYARQEELPF